MITSLLPYDARMMRSLSYWPRFWHSRLKGLTLHPSCVIANGIPKSGTYLLDSLIQATGNWTRSGMHIVNEGVNFRFGRTEWSRKGDTIRYINRLSNGQYANAHLEWRSNLESLFQDRPGLRHILIYRDPRDTIVSMMRWQSHSQNFARNPHNKARQIHLQKHFSSDSERLTHFILMLRDFDFSAYAPWLKSDFCYAVRFEDVYSELADSTAGQAISGIFAFLSLPPPNLQQLREKALHTGLTSSGTEKKIGTWRELFTKEHLQLLDWPKFRSGVEDLGYPWP